MNTVTFGGKNSYNDWGLILSSKEISFPETKTETIEISGADGVIDLTEYLTNDVRYNNRELSFTFTVVNAPRRYAAVYSNVANYLHGQKLQIILSDDSRYYYTGRCSIDEAKSDSGVGSITIKVDAEPYKMDIYSSLDNWEWDTFSFEDGIIYPGTVTISTNDGYTINVVNLRKWVVPKFTTSADITLEFEGTTYTLEEGTSTNDDIILKSGDNYMTFYGSGTVSIEYRGGQL